MAWKIGLNTFRFIQSVIIGNPGSFELHGPYTRPDSLFQEKIMYRKKFPNFKVAFEKDHGSAARKKRRSGYYPVGALCPFAIPIGPSWMIGSRRSFAGELRFPSFRRTGKRRSGAARTGFDGVRER